MDWLKKLILRFKDPVLRGVEIFQESNMSAFSGYVTLFIVISVIPFAILIISVVNLIPGYSAGDTVNIISRILPDLEPVRELVESILNDLKVQSGGLLTSVAALTTLWSASRGVMAFQEGLDQLDRKGSGSGMNTGNIQELVTKGKSYVLGIIKRLVFTVMLIVLFPALLVFEMLRDSIAEILISVIKRLYPNVQDSILENIGSVFHVSWLVAILVAILVILFIYTFLPALHRTFKSQLHGALIAGVCCFVFTELYAFFIPKFYNASNIYGSLAVVFLLILWIRYVVMIIFAGSVLNHVLEEGRLNNANDHLNGQCTNS